MKLMQRDHISRSFNLRWDDGRSGIVVLIHKDCILGTKAVSKDSPWVRSVSETHELDGLFDSFSGDLTSGSFGFNRSVTQICEDGDYVHFFAPIPKVRIETCFACEGCGGSGSRIEDGEKWNEPCLRCRGSGRKYVNDFRVAYATVASLSLLFNILDLNEVSSAKEEKHIRISMAVDHGQHGSSLGGCFGVQFSDYLTSNPTKIRAEVLPEAIAAMETAYGLMWKLESYDWYQFRGDIHEGGYLHLDCPGDACGIHHSDHGRGIGYGREFSCHNVDTPLQSLSLLAGIASMVGQVDDLLSGQ